MRRDKIAALILIIVPFLIIFLWNSFHKEFNEYIIFKNCITICKMNDGMKSVYIVDGKLLQCGCNDGSKFFSLQGSIPQEVIEKGKRKLSL